MTSTATTTSPTTTLVTTTSASTTTTTSPPTTPALFPTTPTTAATTTTTVAVPDLTPSVEGPEVLLCRMSQQKFTIVVRNVGTAPTNGSAHELHGQLAGHRRTRVWARIDASFFSPFDDWTVVEVSGDFGSEGVPGTPTLLTFTSVDGLVILPGASSSVSFNLRFNAEFGDGAFNVDVTLPPLIGGETNGTNNTASHSVHVVDTRG